MMKTVRIFVIILICLLLLPSVVMSADSILQPENDFYEQYRNQMVELRRDFIANGEDGFAALREAPGAKDETGRLQNGEKIYILYVCLYDGEYWGVSDEDWIRMDQLLVLYDYVSFEKDHFDELYLYQGDYEKLKETLSAIAWPWPGADAPLWTTEDIEMEYFSITYAYLDSQGREWVFVDSRYDGYIWICMSDLMNSDIPAFNPAPEPTKWVPERKYAITKIEPTDSDTSVDSSSQTSSDTSVVSTSQTSSDTSVDSSSQTSSDTSVVSSSQADSNTSVVSSSQTDSSASGDSSSQIHINTSGDSTEYTDIKTSENTMLWLIIGLVAAVVFGTAVLIRVFWKPNKKEQGGNANEDG
ncbi:MAG TPA: hypothetical protein PK629_08275 [Oscillospiraceae bacterium]|nr:hypothetical protein [Oscillospiraceae bacterium]HPF56611.1 hypothetical protein [Clostridiales bacterium]HPK35455.1 hypothetical protein [Oscillospiraceae bacterium]HPR75179.1 hypothetical protein [Oscillospiraceae bacterium]